MNRFISILETAREKHWCTRPFCTTCSATEFREALRRFGGVDQSKLAYDLANLDLNELEKFPDWTDAIRLALDELQAPLLTNMVLSNWLHKLDKHVRLADIVLFYYVRRGAIFAPMSVDLFKHWFEKCIEIALYTKDESLVESLIYTLGSKYKNYSALNVLVNDLAPMSRRISLAIQRIGHST